MSAIRLARGFTGRDKIIKFEGHYHGHVDSLLVAAGSGALTHGEPDSAGIPRSFAAETITLPFNLPERVEEVSLDEVKDEEQLVALDEEVLRGYVLKRELALAPPVL